ncbi:MAG TPA: DUF3471 domain-containing protein [Thermoanaerobaculia bacterium]
MSLTKAAPSYAGTFENELYGTLTLRAEGDKLRAAMGRLSAELEPYTEPETARVELIPGTGEVLRFELDENGRAVAVKYHDEVFRRVK